MQVRDVMTKSPVCCPPDMQLREVARLMAEFDCGEIPVVDGGASRPVGVITDRDITCRAVGRGRNPLELRARDCMTSPAVTVTADTSLEECLRMMSAHQIRRVPVIDAAGSCCGIVSQADVALNLPNGDAAQLLKALSVHRSTPAQPEPAMSTDPVCGMRVPVSSSESTAFGGHTYYFCSERCHQLFNARPEDYAAPVSSWP